LFLLDTNHCFRLIAGDAELLERLAAVGSETVVTSVIVGGELLYGAMISQRAEENAASVRRFLNAISVIPISTATAEHYGSLKASLLGYFGQRERIKRRNFDLSKIGFTDSDLWIAATALQHRAKLVSSDSDFQRMREVASLQLDDWAPLS